MNGRSQIVWFGRPANSHDIREAENRGLTIIRAVDHTVDLTYARAAVFWASTGHYEAAVTMLEEVLERSIDFGLLVFIVVSDDAQFNDVERVLKRILPDARSNHPIVLRNQGAEPHEAPNAALVHDCGPWPNCTLRIEGATLTPRQELLVRRAFSDCSAVKLDLITGGLSGATTFLVAATLTASHAGPEPSPFFAKIGPTPKLRDEMRRFREYAEHHIEFYLRPNFQPERRLYGVRDGILVGSFVRSSGSLADHVLQANGPQLIRSLFEETLGGLRRQANTATTGSVVGLLEPYCRHERIPESRVTAAMDFGKDVNPPHVLWRKLLNLPADPWRQSAMHGDMHGENVRVRKGDAIVIDFAQAARGPMSADLANLEVWFAFHLASTAGITEWQARVDFMYAAEHIVASLGGGTDQARTHSDWLSDCVHEIRKLAVQSVEAPDEYLRVIAVYLLRYASFKARGADEAADERRKTFAYWLANRLVLAICARHSAKLECA